MRSVTGGAAFEFEWAVFKDERSLLISVALDARRIGAYRKFCLFLLESTMGIMAIATLHGAFEYLMMKWFTELRFRFVVAGHTKLWLI